MTLRTTSGVPKASGTLGAQHTTVTAASDTNENTVYTLVIPAGSVGPSDTLRMIARFTTTNSANNKTVRTRFNGTVQASLSATLVSGGGGVVAWNLANRGVTNSQIGGFPTVSANATPVTGVIDFSIAQTLTITVQLATGTEVISLESIMVEVLRG